MDGSPKWAALAAYFVRAWKTTQGECRNKRQRRCPGVLFHARKDFWQEAKQSSAKELRFQVRLALFDAGCTGICTIFAACVLLLVFAALFLAVTADLDA